MADAITDETFDGALAQAGANVLLFFGSNACGPTIAMFPIVDEFIDQMPEFQLVAASIEACPEKAKQYQIKHTPSSIVILDGEPVGTLAGTATLEQFIGFVADVVSRPKRKAK